MHLLYYLLAAYYCCEVPVWQVALIMRTEVARSSATLPPPI
jgi:hypothetical protein